MATEVNVPSRPGGIALGLLYARSEKVVAATKVSAPDLGTLHRQLREVVGRPEDPWFSHLKLICAFLSCENHQRTCLVSWKVIRALWNLSVKEIVPSLANDHHPSKPSLLNRIVQKTLASKALVAHVFCWACLSQCSFRLRCCSASPAGIDVCDLLIFETASLLDHSAAVLCACNLLGCKGRGSWLRRKLLSFQHVCALWGLKWDGCDQTAGTCDR